MDASMGPGGRDDFVPAPVLSAEDVAEHLGQLAGWNIDNARLVKSFHFQTSGDAVLFVNRACETAQTRNHHPHMYWWKRDVRIELYTHKSNGLTIRDFNFAACCDNLSEKAA
jgi:4a-hydroxytetrahydrobiopterin dehydratase